VTRQPSQVTADNTGSNIWSTGRNIKFIHTLCLATDISHYGNVAYKFTTFPCFHTSNHSRFKQD
jgi:hypothetical protein